MVSHTGTKSFCLMKKQSIKNINEIKAKVQVISKDQQKACKGGDDIVTEDLIDV